MALVTVKPGFKFHQVTKLQTDCIVDDDWFLMTYWLQHGGLVVDSSVLLYLII